MRSLVFSHIVDKPIRTIAIGLTVAIEVILILLVRGLSSGLLQDFVSRLEGSGADIVVQPPRSSFVLASSTAAVPAQISNRLAQLPNIQTASPVIVQFDTSDVIGLVFAIEPNSFSEATRGFNFLSGGSFKTPYDAVVDDIFAKSKSVGKGDSLKLFNQTFKISGIVEYGNLSRIFIPLSTMQQLIGAPGKASLFLVKNSRGAEVASVIESIKQILPGYNVTPMAEFAQQISTTTTKIPALQYFHLVTTTIACLIGCASVFLCMYTSVLQRQYEIGVLKSIGANRLYIVRLLLCEGLMLGVLGSVAGIVLSFVGKEAIGVAFPSLRILLSPAWIALGCLIALLSSAVGTFYPAILATGKEPADLF